jgi:ribosome-binding factor A
LIWIPCSTSDTAARTLRRGVWEIPLRHRTSRRGQRPASVHSDFADALERGRRSAHRHNKPDHHTLALCRQVQRTLALALSGECDDDLLREGQVVDVQPAAGPKRLLVRVAIGPETSVVEFMQRIESATPRLRAIVAQAITRKRVPELLFVPCAIPEDMA